VGFAFSREGLWDKIPRTFGGQTMRIHSKFFCAVLALGLVLVAGCKKDTAEPGPAMTAEAPTAPAAATAMTASAPVAANGGSAETTAKIAGAQWALKQDEIKNDPKGQWAIAAEASSTYNDAKGMDSWSANQATGAPNVDKYADDGHAWAPKTPDAGIEWLVLTFPKPVHAEEVRVRESCGSGAVIKVEVLDEQNTPHAVWAGNDPTTDLNYLIVKFPKTEFKTGKVKVTLATNVVPGWNEIDAVQLVGAE
jgi:hypothetical protein